MHKKQVGKGRAPCTFIIIAIVEVRAAPPLWRPPTLAKEQVCG